MKHKKILKLLIIIIILTAITAVFSACDDKDNYPEAITLSFVTNMPNFNIEPIVITREEEAYMPENPVRAGFTFMGWYYDENCTRIFTVDDGLTEDTMLYAKWKDNSGFGSETDPIIVESGGFSYVETNDYYIITAYNGNKSAIVIPDNYNQKPVVEIKKEAFKNNTIIEKITIGSVLQKIGEDAFLNCNHLKEFIVRDSDYFSASDGVLYNRDKNSILQVGMANGAKSFEVGKKVDIIRKGAFYGMSFDITFAENGKYSTIAEDDFYGFSGRLILNSVITAVEKKGLNGFEGELLFSDNNNITTITMGFFEGYAGKAIVLPEKITQIQSFAFAECKSDIDIRKLKIAFLPEKAFYKYGGTNIIIPKSVKDIGENAFYESSATVTFEEGSVYKTIKNLTFARFKGIAFMPVSANEIENNAFWELSSQAEIHFSLRRSQVSVDSEYSEKLNAAKNIYFAN